MKLNWKLIRYILGLLLLMEAAFLLASAGVGVYYHFTLGESDWLSFLLCGLGTGLLGWLLYWGNRQHSRQISTREGFLVVSSTWIIFPPTITISQTLIIGQEKRYASIAFWS